MILSVRSIPLHRFAFWFGTTYLFELRYDLFDRHNHMGKRRLDAGGRSSHDDNDIRIGIYWHWGQICDQEEYSSQSATIRSIIW